MKELTKNEIHVISGASDVDVIIGNTIIGALSGGGAGLVVGGPLGGIIGLLSGGLFGGVKGYYHTELNPHEQLN